MDSRGSWLSPKVPSALGQFPSATRAPDRTRHYLASAVLTEVRCSRRACRIHWHLLLAVLDCPWRRNSIVLNNRLWLLILNESENHDNESRNQEYQSDAEQPDSE